MSSRSLIAAGDQVLAHDTLTRARLRNATWIDLPITWSSSGAAVELRITPAAGAVIDLDDVEVFERSVSCCRRAPA